EQLGVSDEAAQKRVNRAVEHLRDYFSKHGLAVGASGLALALSAYAVQAAPVSLASGISGATVAGTTLAHDGTAARIFAMTTLQKTLVGVTIAVLTGAGIYGTQQSVQLRGRIRVLEAQQAPLTEAVQQLAAERDKMSAELAALREERDRLN